MNQREIKVWEDIPAMLTIECRISSSPPPCTPRLAPALDPSLLVMCKTPGLDRLQR